MSRKVICPLCGQEGKAQGSGEAIQRVCPECIGVPLATFEMWLENVDSREKIQKVLTMLASQIPDRAEEGDSVMWGNPRDDSCG